MAKKRSITTGRGDEGETSLLDGSRTGKGTARPEAYGALDEASAFIGLARAKTELPLLKEGLLELQNLIYVVNSELACPKGKEKLLKRKLAPEDVKKVSGRIDEIESFLELPAKFVLPGESETSALLDVARTVVRRAERAFARISAKESPANRNIPALLNRLSDLLFLMARLEEKEAGISPRHPQ